MSRIGADMYRIGADMTRIGAGMTRIGAGSHTFLVWMTRMTRMIRMTRMTRMGIDRALHFTPRGTTMRRTDRPLRGRLRGRGRERPEAGRVATCLRWGQGRPLLGRLRGRGRRLPQRLAIRTSQARLALTPYPHPTHTFEDEELSMQKG